MANENKTLNKPFRLPQGSAKKFGVYVKNDKGNVVVVKFGDPNMSIKRDDPERRSNYRARHNCDNPGPKWKANYWSCKMWSAKPVSQIVGSEEDYFDFDNLPSQEEIIALDRDLENVKEEPIEFSFAEVEYLDKEKYSQVKEVADRKFGEKNSYVKNLFVLREYKKRGGKVKYSGDKPKDSDIKTLVKSSLFDDTLWNLIEN
jgi:hypothetical protein